MLPSLHDNYLVSYEVNCEAHQIKLHTQRPKWADDNNVKRTIVFDGVEGYHLENDAFGNIILSLDVITVEELFSKYGSSIVESYRVAGAPGPWAADLAAASRTFADKGIRGFILTSTYGLSGWLLAKDVSVLLG
jgi:hypothetical protein